MGSQNSSPLPALQHKAEEQEDEEEEEDEDSSPRSPESLQSPILVHGHKKREKSLGQLCVQFIGLFVLRSRELSLEQAANMLTCNSMLPPEYHKIKTKVSADV